MRRCEEQDAACYCGGQSKQLPLIHGHPDAHQEYADDCEDFQPLKLPHLQRATVGTPDFQWWRNDWRRRGREGHVACAGTVPQIGERCTSRRQILLGHDQSQPSDSVGVERVQGHEMTVFDPGLDSGRGQSGTRELCVVQIQESLDDCRHSLIVRKTGSSLCEFATPFALCEVRRSTNV
jgi:hypothetical protein